MINFLKSVYFLGYLTGISYLCITLIRYSVYMEKKIKFQYQVKQVNGMFSMSTIERYEVKELIHVCDHNKSDRENLDDAFCKACELGANPNKQVRWSFI